MKCLVCSNNETRVIDSRVSSDGVSVRRRRECVKCDFRFSTVEGVELLDLSVVKSDGRKEPYLRGKLESGLRRALEKRTCETDGFRSLLGLIERDIQRLRRSEVMSSEIGEIVMQHLRQFDSVAYIRFASVYRSFEDVENFREELNRLVKRSSLKKKLSKTQK
ncbi:transcriptional regulator NrdR [Candidatus Uhrbacteria bacterium RIFOXYC2_FULL_47_19]|uniref:Transcriptional repressor NrdR n=1 Tax=Candidatus Uhrbacteria bacterium RIFOXYC2_FULL_47_19 TaxID=1802424 RepID=A0A1F7WEI2_9BACT|nr:MAG: transcriptional regulator NrdR [Candidatus Uhrbacteria bacterium RIFOXYC2_FULL_47_19]HCC22147.1 transcriptional regulator NrdR [Candidatus Uhrbacteria bacterium]